MSIESVMLSNHLILWCPLLLLPLIFPSIGIFSNESVFHIRWPKYWSFSISPSNEYSALISFRIDWLDLCGAKEILKSLLQHHGSKAQIFGIQLSLWSNFHIHSRLLKNHSFDQTHLCWQNSVSAFEYAIYVGHSFSPKEQASFNFMAAVTICNDFGAQKNKVSHYFCFPIYFLSRSDGTRCHDLGFLNVEF